MAYNDASRRWRFDRLLLGALLGACFGLACNTTADVGLETYGDGAAEDYGCILGDLGCECAAGDVCDAGLTCQSDVCKCLSADCALPPTTGDGDPMGTETAGDGDGDPTTGDGDGDPTTGDGDGDPTTGDGDGDPTTGDGDGDPTTGDGDGDPTTGDGDGDPTTGDGDGDPTA